MTADQVEQTKDRIDDKELARILADAEDHIHTSDYRRRFLTKGYDNADDPIGSRIAQQLEADIEKHNDEGDKLASELLAYIDNGILGTLGKWNKKTIEVIEKNKDFEPLELFRAERGGGPRMSDEVSADVTEYVNNRAGALYLQAVGASELHKSDRYKDLLVSGHTVNVVGVRQTPSSLGIEIFETVRPSNVVVVPIQRRIGLVIRKSRTSPTLPPVRK